MDGQTGKINAVYHQLSRMFVVVLTVYENMYLENATYTDIYSNRKLSKISFISYIRIIVLKKSLCIL